MGLTVAAGEDFALPRGLWGNEDWNTPNCCKEFWDGERRREKCYDSLQDDSEIIHIHCGEGGGCVFVYVCMKEKKKEKTLRLTPKPLLSASLSSHAQKEMTIIRNCFSFIKIWIV